MAEDGQLARLATDQHGAFSRRQALDLGFSSGQIDRRLRTGRWVALRPGVFAIGGSPPTWHRRLMACCLAIDAPATHRASGALWQVGGFLRPAPELTVEHGRRVVVRGAVVHQSRDLHRVELVRREGIPTTPLDRTVLDLGAVLGEDEYGALVRGVVREGRLTWDELYETVVLHSRRGRDGVGHLRAVVEAEYGSVATESELEHLVERLLLQAGLPRPVRQLELRRDDGRVLARVDLAYPAAKVAIELDGRQHHVEPGAFERDRQRQNDLVLLGWLVLRFTWQQLLREPARIVSQVRRALGDRSVA